MILKKLKLLVLVFVFILIVISLKATAVSSQTTVNKHPILTGDKTQANIPFDGTTDHIYHITGNLTISGNNAGTRTGVVFVSDNLNITGNYFYGSSSVTGPVAPTIGTVFVVKSNVNIHKDVTRIDAVIISEGIICTAYDGTSCPANVSASQLTINGSLISINQTDAVSIKFHRSLADNTQPAEKINHQVKYLVILKDLYSDTLQKWSEVP